MYKAKVTDIIIGLIIHTYIAFNERVIYIYSANSNKSVIPDTQKLFWN